MIAVFFDLFETLITEYDPNWHPGLSVADRLNIDNQKFKKEWHKRKDLRHKGNFFGYRDILIDICRTLNVPIDDNIINELYQERIRNKARSFENIDNNVLKMLEDLKEMKLMLGLISNCEIEEVLEWEKCQLPLFFDIKIFSYEVKMTKPSKEIYLYACKQSNVKLEDSIFVGDGNGDELAGAKNTGMTPIQAKWFVNRWPMEYQIKLEEEYLEANSPAELVNIVLNIITGKRN